MVDQDRYGLLNEEELIALMQAKLSDLKWFLESKPADWKLSIGALADDINQLAFKLENL
jgi:hypothetical protein